mmetsp:Transcript_23636/g.41998  ORF Transcript_23636/g.41998 Transcript_23636/m.41998 type:complete len:387 (-) Transcript_23636:67-1227(-)
MIIAHIACRLALSFLWVVYVRATALADSEPDWHSLRAVDESLLVCRSVKAAFLAGSQPPQGGRIPLVASLSSESRIFYYHVPKCGGSSFSTLLPRLVGSVLSPVIVSSPEFRYPESAAAVDSLKKHMGRRLRLLRKVHKESDASLLWPGKANIVSREWAHMPRKTRLQWLKQGQPLLHALYKKMQSNRMDDQPFQIVFVRRADDRVASQFHHDALRGRLGCLNNTEEVARHCFPRGLSLQQERLSCVKCDETSELKYSETTSKLLMPAHSLAGVHMIGVTEHYSLSICLFLHTFKLRNIFDSQCLQSRLKPPVAMVVNSAHHQMNTTFERKKAQERFLDKKTPGLCGTACKLANVGDYELWKTALNLFWWRVNHMALEVGVELHCE